MTEQRTVHPVAQLRKDIEKVLPTLALKDEKEQSRMSSVLMIAVERDPGLLFADRQSLISAVRQCANHGIVPDGNEATLQVYNTKVKVNGQEKWIKKVQYQPMIRGIVNRVQRSGKVLSFWAELVYEGEEFKIDSSNGDRRPSHSPDYFNRSEKIVGAYAVAKLANGTIDCEPMTMKEIQKVKNVAKTKKIWDTWFEEKAKVAVMRRLSKRLPLSAEDMAFIMNEQEHDFEQEEPKDVTPPEQPGNLAQRIAAQNGEKPATDEDVAADDAETIDGEVVTEHEFEEESVDPFTDEYAEGIDAAKNGKDESANPHPPRTFEHNNWIGGHRFATTGMDGTPQ